MGILMTENAIRSIECILLEWSHQLYLVPLSLFVEAILFDPFSIINETQNAHPPQPRYYRWKNGKLPLMTLDLKAYDLADKSKQKVAILRAKVDPTKPQYTTIAMCFSNEAKQITVRPSELSWEDPTKRIALLTQTRLTESVIIFECDRYFE